LIATPFFAQKRHYYILIPASNCVLALNLINVCASLTDTALYPTTWHVSFLSRAREGHTLTLSRTHAHTFLSFSRELECRIPTWFSHCTNHVLFFMSLMYINSSYYIPLNHFFFSFVTFVIMSLAFGKEKNEWMMYRSSSTSLGHFNFINCSQPSSIQN